MSAQKYGRDFFVEDFETGIAWTNLIHAVQVYSVMRGEAGEKVSVRQIADAFHVTDATVQQAAEEHPWMFIEGPPDDPTKQFIWHEGE